MAWQNIVELSDLWYTSTHPRMQCPLRILAIFHIPDITKAKWPGLLAYDTDLQNHTTTTEKRCTVITQKADATRPLLLFVQKLVGALALLTIVQLALTAPRRFFRPDDDIDLSGCGKTKGCVVSPAGCTVDNCHYIYTHMVDPQNPQMVHIELAATSHGWVAVGYNNMKSMVSQLLISITTWPCKTSVPIVSMILERALKNYLRICRDL